MRKILRFILLFTISVFVIIILMIRKTRAQETKVVSDFEQWTSIGLSTKLTKNWELSFEQNFRFTNNASQFDIYFSDLGFDYKINKHFYLGANYRFYQNKNKDGDFKTQHRWSTDFTYKQKVSRFKVSYRLRFQNKDEDFYTSETSNNLYNLRNRLSIKYNIKGIKLDPFIETELYRQILEINSSELSKLRWTIGLEYPLKKFGDIETFYRLDNELNQSNSKDTYIIGLGYKFKF